MSSTSSTRRIPRTPQNIAANARRVKDSDPASLHRLKTREAKETDSTDDSDEYFRNKCKDGPRPPQAFYDAIDDASSESEDINHAQPSTSDNHSVTGTLRPVVQSTPTSRQSTVDPEDHSFSRTGDQDPSPDNVPIIVPSKPVDERAAVFRQESEVFVAALGKMKDLPQHLEKMTSRWESTKRTLALRDQKIKTLTEENEQLKAEIAKLKLERQESDDS